MSYNAINKLHSINKEKYNLPFPKKIPNIKTPNSFNLKTACLDFIQNDCEDLLFDINKSSLNDLDGKSICPNIIPFNAEKDINRYCLQNAIEKFLENPTSSNAFIIYFIFIEIYLGSYKDYMNYVESFIEFEQNSSVLLMKHRDHYVHSVYVFLLGIATYKTNSYIKKTFNKFYNVTGTKANHLFLKY